MKLEFPFNLLNKRLVEEEKMLIVWNKVLVETCWTASAKRQAKGNIPSTEARIKQLKEAMEIIKVIV